MWPCTFNLRPKQAPEGDITDNPVDLRCWDTFVSLLPLSLWGVIKTQMIPSSCGKNWSWIFFYIVKQILLTQKSKNFSKCWLVRGHSVGAETVSSTGRVDIERYIIGDKSEAMAFAEWNPAEHDRLSLHGCGRRCAATASRVVEGSGKDSDSFGFDFPIVAAIFLLPWGPFLGPSPDKFKWSIIQLLPLHSCHRAHSLIIPVFSLQTEEPGHKIRGMILKWVCVSQIIRVQYQIC